MTQPATIDKGKTAVLIMDFQQRIISNIASEPEAVVQNAAKTLEGARKAGIPVIYVALKLRPGYPEIPPRNKTFRSLRAAGRLLEGSNDAEIHPTVAPQPGDVVVIKRRVGSFSTTDMESVLKGKDITCLVLLGIATSGVTLTTVREAADRDFEMIVLADCCFDSDEEVHRVLTQKIFSRQATVVNAQDFLQAIGKS